MDSKGYYAALGLSAGASENDIKKAYSRKILKYHPDQGSETKKVRAMPDGPEKEKRVKEIEEKIRKLNEAKNVLCDAEKKKLYDQGIDDNTQGFNMDMEGFDIFDFMGGGRRRERAQKKVADTEFNVKFTLKDSFLGRQKTFNVKRDVICKGCSGLGGKDSAICSKCNGKGEYQVKRQMGFMFSIDSEKCDSCNGQGTIVKGPPCSTCKGQRYLKQTESVSVEFKRGFKNGETIQIKGKGDEYVGAIPGDLVLTAQIEPDPVFRRIDNHLIVKADVDLNVALLGGNLSLRNIDGTILNITVSKMSDLREGVFIVHNMGFPGGNLYIEPNFIVNSATITKLRQNYIPFKPHSNGQPVTATLSKLPKEQQKSREGASAFKDTIFSSFFGGFS
ncbi:Molecular chaperone (DnaJ superfamily) [Pseudoloma neurophilia]|uniref:Molecular chaperone (DnaJ superfamily) n=1 Tax=Pseudoloma neurophilia TaxID=146866 RepID=A0A0R0LWM9_9MICR|nr:Molecular chaperone (DnaJ superfamily) [Pseudoloma neurophilia]